MGWCAVLPRLSCARLGRCHPARLRCPGLRLGAGGGRMCEGLLSVERAVCTWGFAVGVPDAANPTPNPTLTLTLTPSINPDPNPNPNPTRRLLTAATYCGYLLRLLTSACALSATGGVPYLSLTSSWCLIVHQLAPVLRLLYLRTAVHMGRSREAAVSLVSATLNWVG